MKRGFTLMELLAVVIILGVVATIITVAVDKTIKDNKEALYQNQLKVIEDGARTWGVKHIKELPDEENVAISIPLLALKKDGIIEADYTNSKTGEMFPNDMYIDISYESGSYIYTVVKNSGTNTGDQTNLSSDVEILDHKYGE